MARPNQLPPKGDWRIWLLMAGRGFGKTRVLSEWARLMAHKMPGSRGAIIAATAADSRDTVVEGHSGILNVCPPWDRPTYQPTKRLVLWGNGSRATLFSADEPNRLRGPQFHWAVCDELAAWRYQSAWDMLEFGLRLGQNPQVVVATTPKPVAHLRRLVKDSEDPENKIFITTGSMYENIDNLAPTFIRAILRKYEGTRLGEQEIHAVLHEDAKYSLWKSTMFEREGFRFTDIPPLERIVVAVDPAIKSGSERNDDELDDKVTETGIIVVGVDRRDHGYVLEDATIAGSPKEWADEAVRMYKKYKADRIVVEINNGGEMVAHTIRTSDPNVAIAEVSASRSKQTRAEPVVALYEQWRIHHRGVLADLETQMVQWEPGAKSPDRMDALVWGLSYLLINDQEEALEMMQGHYEHVSR